MDLDVPKAHPSSPRIIPEEEKLDHRRRRRNRMRASCLNCYASKRKCDKKRPCGRCVRLGTTGLCIYEVEDTGDGLMDITEVKRLRQRISELESVVRELKRNPHPRWTAPGGIVHDPEFFDSFRRHTPHVMEERTCLSSRVDDAASMRGRVKAEEVSYPQELVATARSVLRGSSQGNSPRFPGTTASFSGNSEVTTTGPGVNPTTTGSPSSYDSLHGPFQNVENPRLGSKSAPVTNQSSTSTNTITACIPFRIDTFVDTPPATRDPHCPDCSPTSDHGFQTTTSALSLQTKTPRSSHKNTVPCNCLTDPMAFGPLLHLGISLRTSREALERLHPLSSDCMLYGRISMLERHIFSFPPHEQNSVLNPSPGTCLSSYSSRAYTTTLPHSPPKEAHEYILSPHPLSHSYSLSHQLAPHSPDPFAYMLDNTGCTPLH